MNLYKLIHITYYKILFIVLSKFTLDFPPKLDYGYGIDFKNSNLNLIFFTLETFDFSDFKPLLFNFNHSNIISEFHFLNNTPPCFIYLFDPEGKLFGHYEFHIHKPDNENAELAFDRFIVSLMGDIFKNCVYEIMKNKNFTKNSKFYMHISNKNVLSK